MNWKVLALTLALASSANAGGRYQPWDTVGINTGADLDAPVITVPADGKPRSWRSYDSERGLTWGTVTVDPGGTWRSYDSERGLRWGYVDVD